MAKDHLHFDKITELLLAFNETKHDLSSMDSSLAETASLDYKHYVILSSTASACLFAIVCNIAVFFSNRKLKYSPDNISKSLHPSISTYIAVLAFNDLVMTLVIGLLIFTVVIFDGKWPLGEIPCKLREPVLNGTVGMSCSLMTLIAAERHQLVLSESPQFKRVSIGHLHQRSSFQTGSRGGALLKTAAIFAIHIVMGIPLLWTAEVLEVAIPIPDFQNPGEFAFMPMGKFCIQSWHSPEIFIVYRLAYFTMSFLIPLGVTFVLHLKIFHHLRFKMPSFILVRRKAQLRRTKVTLIAVVLVFAFCWLPHQLLVFFIDLKMTGDTANVPFADILPDIICCFKVLTILQAGINPLLYSFNLNAESSSRSTRNSSVISSAFRSARSLRSNLGPSAAALIYGAHYSHNLIRMSSSSGKRTRVTTNCNGNSMTFV